MTTCSSMFARFPSCGIFIPTRPIPVNNELKHQVTVPANTSRTTNYELRGTGWATRAPVAQTLQTMRQTRSCTNTMCSYTLTRFSSSSRSILYQFVPSEKAEAPLPDSISWSVPKSFIIRQLKVLHRFAETNAERSHDEVQQHNRLGTVDRNFQRGTKPKTSIYLSRNFSRCTQARDVPQ